MANSAGAKKRIKTILKKTTINKSRLNRVRTFIKKLELLISSGEKQNARDYLSTVESSIAKAAQKGTIHKNTARRKISNLTLKVKNIPD